MRQRWRCGALVVLVAFGALLAACSGSDDEAGTATEDAAQDDQVAAGEGEGGDPGTDAGVPDVDLAAQAAAGQRQVISTALLTVEVDDLDEAGDDAAALATDAGGYVAGEDTDRGSGATSTLTLKVLPEDFDATLAALGELGEVREQQISTDDVTEALVDLESRIATAEASVDRLRALTEQAGSIEDLTTLESELLERETTLEQLRGEQRTLEDQVALATVTVTFVTEDGDPVVDEDERDLPSFLGGLEAGWDALVAIVAVALAVLGFLLPFLIPLAVLAAVVLVVVRRRSRPHDDERVPDRAAVGAEAETEADR